ncbi:RHS repeat-associated core domain-containing protein [Chitinimonas koreensis]|nr:RHS repeat-associated core domain-containing protein [Chitinimonas koreensis]
MLAYDAWGKRRSLDGATTLDTLDGVVDNKGFTGHEMMDGLDLVHMNGRVYDPLVARFISADPIIQEPDWGRVIIVIPMFGTTRRI